MSVWKNRDIVASYLNKTAMPNAADQIQAMLLLLQQNELPVRRFVDLGAGDGIVSQIVLDRFAGASGVMVDFSKPMLAAARKRLATYAARMRIVEADIAAPDWQASVFSGVNDTADAIVSRYSIHHLHHGRKYELYEEIFHRLNPGGLFVHIEHVASKSSWGEQVFNELMIERIAEREHAQQTGKTPEQIRHDFLNRPDQAENKLLSAETQCSWLNLIGFTDVDIYFKSFELAVFAGRKPR